MSDGAGEGAWWRWRWRLWNICGLGNNVREPTATPKTSSEAAGHDSHDDNFDEGGLNKDDAENLDLDSGDLNTNYDHSYDDLDSDLDEPSESEVVSCSQTTPSVSSENLLGSGDWNTYHDHSCDDLDKPPPSDGIVIYCASNSSCVCTDNPNEIEKWPSEPSGEEPHIHIIKKVS